MNVLVQEVWDGRVWAARPMRVVEESERASVLWFPRGTRWQAPTSPPTRARAASRADRLSSAIALAWGYYGNIQLPFERTRCGFRTMDLVLDVVVELDGSSWLKDDDELAVFVETGVVDADPPFDGSWDEWRPDREWTTPALPAGWEHVCR